MTDQPENPQAYPCLDNSGFGSLSMRDPGMTLRDYFAGQALAGDMAAQSPELGEWANDTSDEALRARAAIYYRFADAMLRERGK